jgi:hypothetical protein
MSLSFYIQFVTGKRKESFLARTKVIFIFDITYWIRKERSKLRCGWQGELSSLFPPITVKYSDTFIGVPGTSKESTAAFFHLHVIA